MAANSALLATIAAATLVAAFAPSIQSASADTAKFVRCTANAVSVSAIGHGVLGVDKRVSKIAIATWQQTTQASIGVYYSDWSRSLGARVDCHRSLFEVTCVATATPCRS